MTDAENGGGAVKDFLEAWPGEDQPMRRHFITFHRLLTELPGVGLSFVGRPGVSYSLRPKHANQTDRELFAMIDVIDDDPRWLSVCFYGDMITDPQERGEVIPGGLAGSDGYCFDMFDDDPALADYLCDRLREAAGSAS